VVLEEDVDGTERLTVVSGRLNRPLGIVGGVTRGMAGVLTEVLPRKLDDRL
jgi:hypothetical protein